MQALSKNAQHNSGIPKDTYLREPAVLKIFPFCRATLWNLVRSGDFPPPRKLSKNVSAWWSEDVREHAESRPESTAA